MKSIKILLKITLIFLLTFSSLSLSAHYGPRSPFGGRVSCAITYNGFVYIGTEEGGVFETTNNQINIWRPRPVGLHSGKITALAHSGSYLFAGTADNGVYIFDGFVGNDRYWIKINNGLGNLEIKSLVAVDSITILAGTNGSGLYKTSNKGASWNAVSNINLNGAVITSFAKTGSRIIAATLSGGVFASDDGGDTWMDFNDINTLNINQTIAVSYNDTTDELMVLNNDGLFIAALASTTTTPVYVASTANLPSGTQIRSLSNNGINWYLATDNGVYVSATGIINWSAENTGLLSFNTTAVVALPSTIVVAVWKTGIYKTNATSVNWVLTNIGFNNPITHSFVAKGDTVVVTATEDGVFVSLATGTAPSYVKSNNGLTDSLNVTDIIFAGEMLLVATKYGGIFSSSDMGASWVAINNGLSDLNILKLFYANERVYAITASDSLFVSNLDVVSWTSLQSGLPNGVVPTSMAFYGNQILLGTLGNGTFVRSYSSTDWNEFNFGLSDLNVTSVTASAGKFFAGTDGNGVFVSNVDTADWTPTAQTAIPHTNMIGLDGSKIQAMESFAGYVYASFKGGVLATSDNGVTWEEGGNQFNLPSFSNIRKISFVSTRIFVLTEHNGPYSNSLNELPTLPNFLTLRVYFFNGSSTENAKYVSLTSNVPWKIIVNDSWLSTNITSGKNNAEIRIDIQENYGITRTGSITLSSDSLLQSFVISINQDGTTGISEIIGMKDKLKIFPNPNNGNFTLDFSKMDATVNRISVFDYTGKLLMLKEVNQQAGHLPFLINNCKGQFYLKIETDKGIVHQKVVVY